MGIGVVIVLACGDGDGEDPGGTATNGGIEPPKVEARHATEYIDVALLSSSFPLCAGTLALLDAHVEYVLTELELSLEERIPLYVFDLGSVPIRDYCRGSGCAYGTTIYTSFSAIPHEIVHAVTASAGRSWWEEGAASGFGDAATFVDPLDGWIENLGRSAHLSRWLVERFGGAAYMELYSRTPRGVTQEGVEAAVRASLGREFDDVLNEYAATAPYLYPQHWECYRPPDVVEVPWRDNFLEYEVHLDCERTDTFTSDIVIHGLQMTARVPVTIPSDGLYWFVAEHPDATLALQPCSDEPTTEPVEGVHLWPKQLLGEFGPNALSAGPHVLHVNLPPGAPATVRVHAYPDIGGPGVL